MTYCNSSNLRLLIQKSSEARGSALRVTATIVASVGDVMTGDHDKLACLYEQN